MSRANEQQENIEFCPSKSFNLTPDSEANRSHSSHTDIQKKIQFKTEEIRLFLGPPYVLIYLPLILKKGLVVW